MNGEAGDHSPAAAERAASDLPGSGKDSDGGQRNDDDGIALVTNQDHRDRIRAEQCRNEQSCAGSNPDRARRGECLDKFDARPRRGDLADEPVLDASHSQQSHQGCEGQVLAEVRETADAELARGELEEKQGAADLKREKQRDYANSADHSGHWAGFSGRAANRRRCDRCQNQMPSQAKKIE